MIEFVFFKIFFSKRNIFLTLFSFNKVILFKSFKQFLKVQDIKLKSKRRYPFKILSEFFKTFMDLILKDFSKLSSSYRTGRSYILLLSSRNYYDRMIVYWLRKKPYDVLPFGAITLLRKKSHGFIRHKKWRRL